MAFVQGEGGEGGFGGDWLALARLSVVTQREIHSPLFSLRHPASSSTASASSSLLSSSSSLSSSCFKRSEISVKYQRTKKSMSQSFFFSSNLCVRLPTKLSIKYRLSDKGIDKYIDKDIEPQRNESLQKITHAAAPTVWFRSRSTDCRGSLFL